MTLNLIFNLTLYFVSIFTIFVYKPLFLLVIGFKPGFFIGLIVLLIFNLFLVLTDRSISFSRNVRILNHNRKHPRDVYMMAPVGCFGLTYYTILFSIYIVAYFLLTLVQNVVIYYVLLIITTSICALIMWDLLQLYSYFFSMDIPTRDFNPYWALDTCLEYFKLPMSVYPTPLSNVGPRFTIILHVFTLFILYLLLSYKGYPFQLLHMLGIFFICFNIFASLFNRVFGTAAVTQFVWGGSRSIHSNNTGDNKDIEELPVTDEFSSRGVTRIVRIHNYMKYRSDLGSLIGDFPFVYVFDGNIPLKSEMDLFEQDEESYYNATPTRQRLSEARKLNLPNTSYGSRVTLYVGHAKSVNRLLQQYFRKSILSRGKSRAYRYFSRFFHDSRNVLTIYVMNKGVAIRVITGLEQYLITTLDPLLNNNKNVIIDADYPMEDRSKGFELFIYNPDKSRLLYYFDSVIAAQNFLGMHNKTIKTHIDGKLLYNKLYISSCLLDDAENNDIMQLDTLINLVGDARDNRDPANLGYNCTLTDLVDRRVLQFNSTRKAAEYITKHVGITSYQTVGRYSNFVFANRYLVFIEDSVPSVNRNTKVARDNIDTRHATTVRFNTPLDISGTIIYELHFQSVSAAVLFLGKRVNSKFMKLHANKLLSCPNAVIPGEYTIYFSKQSKE